MKLLRHLKSAGLVFISSAVLLYGTAIFATESDTKKFYFFASFGECLE